MKITGLFKSIKLFPLLLLTLALLSAAAFAQALTWPGALTHIETEAFYNDTSLTGPLNLPDSIIYIGPRAFAHCTGLTGTLELPDSVTYIGDQAFAYCTGLTGTVVIPEGVTYLAPNAFEGTNLTILHAGDPDPGPGEGDDDGDDDGGKEDATDTDITTDTDIPGDGEGGGSDQPITSDTDLPGDGGSGGSGGSEVITMTDLPEGYEFEMTAEGAVITAYTGVCEGELTLPATINGVPVVAIGDRAFQDCYGLTGSIVIPSTVKRIGASAFRGCGSLDGQVVIPCSVQEIGAFAFFDCFGLTGSLTIPGSVRSIGQSAFAFCEGMTGSLTLPAGISLGSRCFQGAGFTGSITIPASMSLGANVFVGTKLHITWEAPAFTGEVSGDAVTLTGWNGPLNAGLTLPATLNGRPVTAIGADAFASIGLQGPVTIPGSIAVIGENAFRSNPGVTSLQLNPGVETIGAYAFGGCSGLTGTIYLPRTAVNVADTAFSGVNAAIEYAE